MTHNELMAIRDDRHARYIAQETETNDLWSACPRCGGPDRLQGCTCKPDDPLFFAAATLPQHYIVLGPKGNKLMLIPVAPIGPEAYERATEYRGNYDVTPAPDYIAAMYGEAYDPTAGGGWVKQGF